MSTISVKTHFAAGHRILGLSGAGAKCRNVHGHTFHATWVFEQGKGDMALEFGELKASLKNLICDNFDHSFILHGQDDLGRYLEVNDLKRYVLDTPPTTEAIAEEIARLTQGKWPKAKLLRVVLEEGPENCATWEASKPLSAVTVPSWTSGVSVGPVGGPTK